MFSTIRRISRNIKWAIFNRPPVGLTEMEGDKPCSYCGSTSGGLWHDSSTDITICMFCKKKVYDHVLLEEED